MGFLKLIGKGLLGVFTGGGSFIVDVTKTVVGGWLEKKKSKQELEKTIQLAKIERITRLDTADIDWDQRMAEASDRSWKDEWFTLVFSIPAVLAFIPGMKQVVLDGFEVLAETPEWYIYTLGVLVAASVGRDKLIDVYRKIKPNKEGGN